LRRRRCLVLVNDLAVAVLIAEEVVEDVKRGKAS
jgi:hypothetical protein